MSIIELSLDDGLIEGREMSSITKLRLLLLDTENSSPESGKSQKKFTSAEVHCSKFP